MDKTNNNCAPWSANSKIKRRNAERVVVYVIGEEGGGACKVGVTGGLKRRMQDLGRGKNMRILFWAEFDRANGFSVERAAHGLLSKVPGLSKGGEWYNCSASGAAATILFCAKREGFTPLAIGGAPWEAEETAGDVQEILAEPVYGLQNSGRLDREYWSPQSRSIFY